MEQTAFTPNQPSVDEAQHAASHEQAHTAGQYLDKALNLIGAKMRQTATLVKERAPREGVAKSALETASQALDTTGQYMMREQVGQDIRGVVRRHPIRWLGVSFAIGLALGNLARSVKR